MPERTDHDLTNASRAEPQSRFGEGSHDDVLTALLEAAVDAIVIIDERGRIVRFSPAAERMFGYPEHEMIGRSVSALMPEPDRHRHDAYIRRYDETGEARIIGIGREVDGVRRNGDVFPMDLSVGEARFGGGERRYVGILRDITERKRTEEDLRKQREALAHIDRLGTMGELATGIAHEINQPLTAISAYAQACKRMILLGTADTDELADALSEISNEAIRAGEIIHRLRAFTRRHETSQEPCDVNALIRDVAKLTEVDAHHRDVPLEHDLAPGLPTILADSVQIQQVIINLVRNALDATQDKPSPRPTVTVSSATDADGNVVVSVRDGGVGIESEDDVFKQFRTTKPDGMGLGLNICQRIVHAHGGRIWFVANPEGGVTFSVALPAFEKGERDG